MIQNEINKLLKDVKKDKFLKQQLLATKNAPDPLAEFCNLCQDKGYCITIGEIIALGQDMNDEKMRSVNGGGAWEIDGWSDSFEDLLAQIQWTC